jgi:N-acetylglucosaminyldiphosphoundecaprenol N-acetyl-beta-D-mannosaminyltransferase
MTALGAPFELLGVPYRPMRFQGALDAIFEAVRTRGRLRVHFLTVHSLIEAHDDPALHEVMRGGLAVSDGMPLVWMARRGGRDAERVCGPEVTLALADQGRARGVRHFLYGGEPGVPEALAERLRGLYPGVQIVGTYSPPFRPLTVAEDEGVVRRINAAETDVLWVGLGSPKQDFWVADHQDRLAAPVLLAVGAAFDFHSGRRRRAPTWMRRAGLEWLFRLATEPRRLFQRYVRTNSKFLFLVAREWILGPR